MAEQRASGNLSRRTISLAVMGLGALLLLAMPVILVVFALTGTEDAHIPGTLVILSASGGMALIVAGAVVRD